MRLMTTPAGAWASDELAEALVARCSASPARAVGGDPPTPNTLVQGRGVGN